MSEFKFAIFKEFQQIKIYLSYNKILTISYFKINKIEEYSIDIA